MYTPMINVSMMDNSCVVGHDCQARSGLYQKTGATTSFSIERNYVYYTDWGTGSLQRVDLTGQTTTRDVVKNLMRPTTFAIVSTSNDRRESLCLAFMFLPILSMCLRFYLCVMGQISCCTQKCHQHNYYMPGIKLVNIRY